MGFGKCPNCRQWRNVTDGHYLCRVCEGYEKEKAPTPCDTYNGPDCRDCGHAYEEHK